VDAWLQGCIAHSRIQLGTDWLQSISRVRLAILSRPGVAGASYAGVVLPSVDRVGSLFPTHDFAELPAALPPMAVAAQGRKWLSEVEALALSALETEDFDVEAFDTSLCASSAALARIEQYYAVDVGAEFPDSARYWRLPVASTERVPSGLIDPLMQQLAHRLQPLTMWWTDGSERVGASCLLSQSLPDESRFVAMLDGQWAGAGWHGEFGDVHIETVPPQFRLSRQLCSSHRHGNRARDQSGPVLERPDAGCGRRRRIGWA
jgi:type VI secretion system protein ImpM